MSWDCELVDPKTNKVLEAENVHFLAGGNYQVGGTKELTLNVTYNYGKLYRKVLGGEGLNDLSGKTGAESLKYLLAGVKQLSNDSSSDYWEATEGNAKVALLQLLLLARKAPQGVWRLN